MDIRNVHSSADASVLVCSCFVYFPDPFFVLQKIWPWKAEWVLLGKGTVLLLRCCLVVFGNVNGKGLKLWMLRQDIPLEQISFPFALQMYEPNCTLVASAMLELEY
jgi:hypothetical protein